LAFSDATQRKDDDTVNFGGRYKVSYANSGPAAHITILLLPQAENFG